MSIIPRKSKSLHFSRLNWGAPIRSIYRVAICSSLPPIVARPRTIIHIVYNNMLIQQRLHKAPHSQTIFLARLSRISLSTEAAIELYKWNGVITADNC